MVEHLAGEQRPQGGVVQLERHGEVHESRAIMHQDQLAARQGISNTRAGRERRQGEGTATVCPRLRGVQATPRRPGIVAWPQHAPCLIDQGDRQVHAVGVDLQNLAPALRV